MSKKTYTLTLVTSKLKQKCPKKQDWLNWPKINDTVYAK